MKYILAILLFVVFTTPVYADGIDVRVIDIEGKPFVAFDREAAQELLQMRIDFPVMELKLDKLSALVTGLNQENRLLSENLDLSKAGNAVLVEENVDLKDTIRSLDSWWRNPWFWFGVGIVCGTGATIAIVYAVNP